MSTPASDPRLRPVAIREEARALSVDWQDGHQSHFHYVWLRDACRCRHCGEPAFGHKRTLAADIPADITTSSARLGNDGSVTLLWSPDGHESSFSGAWLRQHCYSDSERERRRSKPTLWDSRRPPDTSPFDLNELTGDEARQLDLLDRLRRFGIAFVSGTAGEGVERVAKLIGYLRETNYGRVFDIKVEAQPRTFADLPEAAPPHTDDAFRPFPPGLLMLECVQASTEGGASLFIDGFSMVARLRAEDEPSVELLSRLPLRFYRSHPGEHDFLSYGRLINLDHEGHLAGVRLALHNIGPPNLSPDQVEPFYAALRRLVTCARDPQLRLVRRLEAGDLVILDNERVLHGRETFTGRSGRHLRGGFLDRDAFHSRWRILTQRLGVGETELTFPGGVSA